MKFDDFINEMIISFLHLMSLSILFVGFDLLVLCLLFPSFKFRPITITTTLVLLSFVADPVIITQALTVPQTMDHVLLLLLDMSKKKTYMASNCILIALLLFPQCSEIGV
jgi:hypothetical protein